MEGMEELLEELYYCRKCRDTCLKGLVCTKYPEPFLGILDGRVLNFAFIGINPGETDNSEIRSLDDYIDDYMFSSPNRDAFWFKGYLETYKRLVNPEATYDDFIKNAIISNVILCSTRDTKSIPKKALEMARDNCMPFFD